MSYNVFPTFSGRGWNIAKRMISSTLKNRPVTGPAYTLSLRQYPRYEFDIPLNALSQTDFATLFGFFGQQGGDAAPFFLTADNESSATNVQFAVANGSTVAFQLMKSSNGWLDPIGGQNGTPTIFANGIQILAAGTGTPATATKSTTAGGSKAARTYFILVTYVDAAGNESNSSTETSQAVALNNLLTVTSPIAAQGAVSWNLYLNTTTNTEKFQVTTALGTNYTEPTSALSFAGAAYPVVDNTTYTVSLTGAVTFARAPANSTALTWTGAYYYLVYFNDPQVETSQVWNQQYTGTTITMTTD